MNYGNRVTEAAGQGMALQAAQLGGIQAVERELSRMEILLNQSAALVDTAGGLVSRIESLNARLFGPTTDTAGSADRASAPQPVRPTIDELQYRLEVVHKLIQRGFDAINRLDRL